MSRCCGNCEWSISPQMEEQILIEQGYDEDDMTRPLAGDCCIGQVHDENYCCPHHLYIEGMEEYKNYVFYDEEYLGQGCLIVSKIDDEIIKFVKISSYGEGCYPIFSIRAYEKDCVDNPNQEFRKIQIDVKQDEVLYDIFYKFMASLNKNKILSIDIENQGKNHLYMEKDMEKVSLVIAKDVYGVKSSTNFVDILIGDDKTCDTYLEFFEFYNNLSTVAVDNKKDDDIKQLLLCK